MQTPGSIIICGHDARCRAIAWACLEAAIHPTLLLPATAPETPDPEADLHSTTDPFSCVADMVLDLSGDDADMIIARCNQLAETNHGDVVFALDAGSIDLELVATRIMHPGRVVGIQWPAQSPDTPLAVKTTHTTEAAFTLTSYFLQTLHPVP